MNPVFIVVIGAQKSLDAPDECKRSRGLPCNEERSERSERDFTVEKSMGEVWPFLR